MNSVHVFWEKKQKAKNKKKHPIELDKAFPIKEKHILKRKKCK